jgi:hypothetical protein
MGSDHLAKRESVRGEERLTILKIARDMKQAASELYFANRRKRSAETTQNTFPTTISGLSFPRDITTVHLSFAACNILIAIPGSAVTFQGGVTVDATEL